MKPITTFEEAHDYLVSFVPKGQQQSFPGEVGWQRTNAIMAALGDPQDSLQVIHVAGTSGKGSVSTMIYEILRALDYQVGLTVSPHLCTVRERFQYDGSYISEADFVTTMHTIRPVIEEFRGGPLGDPTYFDLIVALAFTYWKASGATHGVVETGMGGLLDGTNCVHRPDKLCVLTPIGYDHMHVLGNTLHEIATQKAGIIQQGNTVCIMAQQPEVEQVFLQAAKKQSASVMIVDPLMAITDWRSDPHGQIVSLTMPESEIEISDVLISQSGRHQAQNAVLAIAAAHMLLKDESLTSETKGQFEAAIRRGLGRVRIPGRFEIVRAPHGDIVMDVAHNTQKIAAFCSDLAQQYGDTVTVPFLVAFKKGKDAGAMIEQIAPFASELILTSFYHYGNDLIHEAIDPYELRAVAEAAGIPSVTIEPDLATAVELLHQRDGLRVITGSLYLIAEILCSGLVHTEVDPI